MSRGYIIPDRTEIERSVRLAGEYGCAFEYNDFYLPEVLDDPEKQQEIIDFYARYRSDFSEDTMHGAFLDVTIHSSDPLIRDASVLRVRQSMEIAKRMGLKGIVFHTGRLAGFRTEGYLKLWHQTNLQFFTKLAEDYPGQQIYMENMFDEAPDVLAKLAEAMRDISNFGVCLDYAHAALTDRSRQEWVKTLAPYIRHMHLNDNNLQNDLHQPIGEGDIDWQEYDRLMKEYQINASVLVEVSSCAGQQKSLEYLSQHEVYPFHRG